MSGLENPSVLDAMALDTATDKVILAMYETREWTEAKSNWPSSRTR